MSGRNGSRRFAPAAGRLPRAGALILVAWAACRFAAVAAGPAAAPKSAPSQQPTATPHEPEHEAERKELQHLARESRQLAASDKLSEAVAAGEKALRLARKVEGQGSNAVAERQDWLASLYEKREDWPAARKACNEALAIRIKLYGEKDWRVTDARLALKDVEVRARLTPVERRELAGVSQTRSRRRSSGRTRKPGDALERIKHALEVHRRLLGNEHPETAKSLQRLAREYDNAGNYPQAEALYRQSLEIRKKVLGENHPDTATTLDNLGLLYWSMGQYAKAEPLALEAVAVRKKVLGLEHRDMATSLNNLGLLYCSMAQYAKAEPLLLEALAVRKKVLGLEHRDTATSLNDLGLLYVSIGEYAKAEPIDQQALAIRRKILGENHAPTALSLLNLAALYDSMGDYTKAEPLYRESLEIYKKVNGEEHPRTAIGLNCLAGFYMETGNYVKAEASYRQALAIQKKVLGERHPDTAATLNGLALLYQSIGQYTQAEPLYQRALAIRKDVLGENHPGTAGSLDTLATLYKSMADYPKAEQLYLQALRIRKNALGESHPAYSNSLNNLAVLYKAMGDNAKVEPLYLQSLAIKKKTLGEAHPDYASSVFNLAAFYWSRKDSAKAEPLYRQALTIDKKALGELHPNYAIDLNSLATVYRFQGKDAKAEPLFREALEIRKKALGEAHPEYAQSLNGLAVVYEVQGQDAKAERLLAQATDIFERLLRNTLRVQSERQQLAFSQSLRWYLDAYLSVTAKTGASASDVYRHVLAWKGAAFMSQAAERALRKRADLKPQFDELASLDVRLSTLALRGPGRKARDVWEGQVALLSDRKESLERQLSTQSSEFRDQRELRDLQPATLQQIVPPNSALVDVLEYLHHSPSTEKRGQFNSQRHLVAFVVRPDRPIARIELGPVKPVADASEAWRRAIEKDGGTADEVGGQGADAAHKPPQQMLKEAIWNPLRKYLDGAQIVLVSPDGVLNQVPLAALPGQKPGSYLVEETKLAILPVPRLLPMLLRPDESDQTKNESLLIVGDVSYGGSPGKAEGIQVATRSAIRGARSGGLEFAELEYSRSEMATIRDSFEKNFSDGKAKALRGNNATETAFRREAPHYRWLHLATHGFFAPPQIASALAAPKEDKEHGFGEFGRQGLSGYHPGLLSGLALSGANTPGAADDDDGILTAVEVAGLDLERADLVVLSACETGLGAVAGGEGVLGLQRAFQLSGAKTTVASLWKIPDRATDQLMKRFYENLWDKKLSKLESLRDAQVWMLKEGRQRGLDLEDAGAKKPKSARLPPRYWAAFVLSGDWR